MLFHLPGAVPAVDVKTGQLSTPHLQLFTNLFQLLNRGVPAAKIGQNNQQVAQSVTIPLGKLTGGGTNGSLTFTNGLLTGYVDPT